LSKGDKAEATVDSTVSGLADDGLMHPIYLWPGTVAMGLPELSVSAAAECTVCRRLCGSINPSTIQDYVPFLYQQPLEESG